ncbi:MAG TPA: hypothetical protein VIN60_06410 [Anaerolineales bacterium]
MPSNPLKPLRILLIVILILLFFQYELGIQVNFSNPAAIPPFGFSIPQISDVLHQAGSVALIHAILGAWLVILTAVNLILSLRSKVKSAQIYGALTFLSMIFAAGGGLFFVLSGFQSDNASHTMATNFLVSFVLLFLELYAIKPEKAKVN